MNNLVYGKRETRGLFPVELQAGKHNYRVDPWSGRFPIHSSCKSCRFERVFKPSFSTVARSFRSFSEGREREKEDGSVNGPSEAISCAPAPLLITSPRVSREGWRGKFTFSCSRISARAVSLGQWGRQFRQENLPRPCFPLRFSWGQREREKKRKEWLLLVRSSRSVHFERLEETD